jgi:hypothetical protein
VVVRVYDFGLGSEAAVLGQFAFVREYEVNLLNILGAELVLVLALGIFPVCIDEEHCEPWVERVS